MMLVKLYDKTLPHPGSLEVITSSRRSHELVQVDDKTLPHPGSGEVITFKPGYLMSWFK